MPSYIVKADRDQDFYVNWSTVVDAPTDWGTRAELEESRQPADVTPERFARADERGTSANWINWPAEKMPFGWGDESFIVMEVDLPNDRTENEDGYYSLPRTNLRAFCERLEAEQDPTDLLVWEFYEDAEVTTTNGEGR